jgi:hypothetical protein
MNQFSPNSTIAYGNYSHTHFISINDLVFEPATTKEKPMSTIEKIAAERREAKERERLEVAYDAWVETDLDSVEDGTVMRYAWTPKETQYLYAAIKTSKGWYITGQVIGAFDDDGFIAHLIERDVTPDDVTWLEA